MHSGLNQETKVYTQSARLMGSAFTFGVRDRNHEIAQVFLNDGINLVKELEADLSEFITTSCTAKINSAAHSDWISINYRSFQLIKRSLSLSELTKGDFDITVAPLKKIYSFKKQEATLPSEALITDALGKVGYQNILLDQNTRSVKFARRGMQISFAAIGKGFAADMVIDKWRASGLKNAFVNASGDIKVLGKKSDNEYWNVGIADPNNIDQSIMRINLDNNAVATSGSSEQFFSRKGVKYSHNINPKTGKPLQYINSVTIVSPSAELSDALATAVYVKGVEAGIEFINQLPQTHAIIFDEQGQVHFTKNLNYEMDSVPA